MLRLSVHVAAIFATLALGFTSCNSDKKATMRQHESSLAAIDDSLAARSSFAPTMIDEALASTVDSVDYYEIYLRKLRYDATTGNHRPEEIDWDRMIAFLERRKPNAKINRLKGSLYNLMGFSHHRYQLNPDTTLSLYDKAYNALLASDNAASLPDVSANIGDVYIDKSDMPMAAKWYRRALLLADSLQLPEQKGLSLHLGLARIYQNIGDFDSAAAQFERICGRMHELEPNMQIYLLNNYGNFLYYSGDYIKAEEVFRRLEKMLTDNGLQDEPDMKICQINLADVYLNLGKIDSAKHYLSESAPYFSGIGNEPGIYYANTIKIGIALTENNLAEATKVIESEKIDGNIDYNLVNIRHRYLIDYYQRKGDFKNAFTALKSRMAHNDSLQHNITHMRTSDIMMRYAQDTLALHHRLAISEKDATIHLANWVIGLSLLGVAAAVALSLYLITLIKKRKLQNEMQLMKLKLVGLRSLISPHFIFNILNQAIAKADDHDAKRLKSLVKLIRQNLRISDKQFITVRDEMDFVNSYLAVVKNDMTDLEVDENLPPQELLGHLYLPTSFIQSLVENSIKHGLACRKGEKRLSIAVSCQGEYMTINVTDNGTGFDICRHDSEAGTGLKLIRSTIALLNRDLRQKISFKIANLTDDTGEIIGCEATINIPSDLQPLIDTLR